MARSAYRTPWVLIDLRHESFCRLCGKIMYPGEEVEWNPSLGHVHPPIDGEYKCHPLNSLATLATKSEEEPKS